MECYVPVGLITQILAGARIHGACCEEKSRPPSQVNRTEEERGRARIKHRDFSLTVKIIVQFVTGRVGRGLFPVLYYYVSTDPSVSFKKKKGNRVTFIINFENIRQFVLNKMRIL